MNEEDRNEAVVVKVTGLVDGNWARRIADVLARSTGPVRIDLSDAILVSRSPLSDVLRRIVASGRDLTKISIVCPRISAVMLLRRWGIADWITVIHQDRSESPTPSDEAPPAGERRRPPMPA